MHIIPKQTTLASTLYITIKTKKPLILTVTTVTLCLGVGFVCINGGKKTRKNELFVMSHMRIRINLYINFSRNQFYLINITEVSCSHKTLCKTYCWKSIFTFESMLKKFGK